MCCLSEKGERLIYITFVSFEVVFYQGADTIAAWRVWIFCVLGVCNVSIEIYNLEWVILLILVGIFIDGCGVCLWGRWGVRLLNGWVSILGYISLCADVM